MENVVLSSMYLLNILKIFGAMLLSMESFAPMCDYTDYNSTLSIFNACGLDGKVNFKAFDAAYQGFEKYHPKKSILAICDFSLPSDQKRFYLIDLEASKLILQTYVAHGKNSGDLYATKFSNIPESLQSSLGFFKVGSQITSPKHGAALLLDGLQKGINDNALTREIIIHGADYVSESFIKGNGRLGRSYGCPALPREDMAIAIQYLAGGALFYIHR